MNKEKKNYEKSISKNVSLDIFYKHLLNGVKK